MTGFKIDLVATKSAIEQFVADSSHKILRIGKDVQGRKFLIAESKTFWNWIPRLIFKDYQLKNVCKLICSKQSELNDIVYKSDNVSKFYSILNKKIAHHNQSRWVKWFSERIDSINEVALKILQSQPVNYPQTTNQTCQPVSSQPDASPQLRAPIQPESSPQLEASTHPEASIQPEAFIQPEPSLPGLSDELSSFKEHLIRFYVNQQARLDDLRSRLNGISSQEKVKIEYAIARIEDADPQRARVALKIQLKRDPSFKEWADYMGKSLNSLRGILLGRAYSNAILEKTAQLIELITSMDSNGFKIDQLNVNKLKKLKKPIDLKSISDQLKMNSQQTADLILSLWIEAQSIPGPHQKSMLELVQKIEMQVASDPDLDVDPTEVNNWIRAIESEKNVALELTRHSHMAEHAEKSGSELGDYFFASLGNLVTTIKEESQTGSDIFISLNKPFHLIKLQNLLNGIDYFVNAFPEKYNKQKIVIDSLKNDISQFIEEIPKNMSLKRRAAIVNILQNQDGMGHVTNALHRVFYRKLGQDLDVIDKNMGTIKAKLLYLKEISQKRIEVLKSTLGKSPTLSEIFKEIPPCLRLFFLQQAAKQQRDDVIQVIIDSMKSICEKQGLQIQEENIEFLKASLQKKIDTVRFVHDLLDPASAQEILEILIPKPRSQQQESLCFKIIRPDWFDVNRLYGILKADDSILNLLLNKIEKVNRRQKDRLEKLKRGEIPIIPQYFHATRSEPATSIAKTGIEPVGAAKGFGAFISTAPETRFGWIIFGLPKCVEFYSSAVTVVPRGESDGNVWSGLSNLISIDPREARLQEHFRSAIRQTVSKILQGSIDLPKHKAMELEEGIKAGFTHSVVFRPFRDETGVHKGWSLNYRLPSQDSPFHKICTPSDLGDWIADVLGSALANLQLPQEQTQKMFNLHFDKLQEHFHEYFNEYYFHSQAKVQNSENHYVVSGHNTDTIKASIIAPDDEDVLFRYFTTEDSSFSSIEKISVVEQRFVKEKISVEAIPLSEQLIELDLLNADSSVPADWFTGRDFRGQII